MMLYLRLAWRNLWRHKRRTLIVMIAIGLSLSLMMMYDGVMNGFTGAIYANAVKVFGGNIQVHADGYREKADETPLLPLENEQALIDAAKTRPEVLAASRRITTGGMATSAEGAFPVSITGIEPEAEAVVSLTAQNVVEGRFLAADDADVIFIGKGLADAMGVSVGDRVTLVGRATHEQMRQRTMTVVGIYDLGLAAIEKGMVYMSLAEAQDLYDLRGQSTEVAITLQRLGQEPAVMAALQPQFPGLEIDSWETSFPELETAVNQKGGVMNVFSVIIMFIAGIGFLNMLLMAVYERTREIGLMGALGMKPAEISNLFLLEGALMGVIGVAAGVLMGLGVNLLLGRVGIDYSQFASLTEYTALINSRISPSLGVEKLGLRATTALVIAILAAFQPAREASRREPAEALHTV